MIQWFTAKHQNIFISSDPCAPKRSVWVCWVHILGYHLLISRMPTWSWVLRILWVANSFSCSRFHVLSSFFYRAPTFWRFPETIWMLKHWNGFGKTKTQLKMIKASLTPATRTNGNSHSKVFPNQGEEAVHIFSGAPLLFYLLHCRHYLIPQCMYWLLYGFLRTATHITNTFFPWCTYDNICI